MNPEQIEKDLAALRVYAEGLPEGDERDQTLEAVREGETALRVAQRARTYAEGKTPPTTPESEPKAEPEPEDDDEDEDDDKDTEPSDDDDDLSEQDLDAMIEKLKGEGYDPDEDAEREPGEPEPGPGPAKAYAEGGPTLKLYSGEAGARLLASERQHIDRAVEALVSGDKITPAVAGTLRAVCYSLMGFPEVGGLRTYSATPERRAAGVNDLLGSFGDLAELGTLRTYSAQDPKTQERDRQAASAASEGTVMVGGRKVNEESLELAGRIERYAEEHGIKDFAQAARAYEQAHKADIRRYAEKG